MKSRQDANLLLFVHLTTAQREQTHCGGKTVPPCLRLSVSCIAFSKKQTVNGSKLMPHYIPDVTLLLRVKAGCGFIFFTNQYLHTVNRCRKTSKHANHPRCNDNTSLPGFLSSFFSSFSLILLSHRSNLSLCR